LHAKLEPNWREWTRLPHAQVPGDMLPWLYDRGSLTARIKRACPEGCFRVKVLKQRWGRPLYGETRLLGMRQGGWAIVREVELRCNGVPWVFARSLIPAVSLRGAARRLSMLGDRPLGELLFSEPGMRRGLIQVARLLPRNRLFEAATGRMKPAPGEVWGRRTLFYMADQPLLVNEIFLPDIPGFPK
jgi:chorismate lyase